MFLAIEYQTSDVDQWMSTFDSDPLGRGGLGVISEAVYLRRDAPGSILLVMELCSAQAAQQLLVALEPVWEISGAQRAWRMDTVTASRR